MSKIHDTAISLLEAEEAFVVAMELQDPMLRPKKLEMLQRMIDAVLKHHMAVEDVQLSYPKDKWPETKQLLKEVRR